MAEEKTVRGMLTGLVDLLKELDKLRRKVEVKGKGEFMGADIEYRYSARYLFPRAETGPKVVAAERGAKEPLVDVFDRGDHIAVVALMPNVREEDLKFGITRDALRISANAAGTKIEKDVSIPVGGEVDKILGASFKNSILEIKLRKKPRTSKEKG